MRGQAYTLDVMLGSVFLLLLISLVLVSQSSKEGASEEVFTFSQTSLLNAMKFSGILADGVGNQTALEQILNDTPSYVCADISLCEVKAGKKGANGNGDGDEDNGKHHGHDDEDNGDNEDDEDNDEGDNNGANGELKPVFTLTKQGCDFASAENLSVEIQYTPLVVLGNNGGLDKTYLYRLRTWPKPS